MSAELSIQFKKISLNDLLTKINSNTVFHEKNSIYGKLFQLEVRVNSFEFFQSIKVHKLIAQILFFAGFGDRAIYRRTRRGGIKLVYQEYEYYQTNGLLNGVQVWRCVNFYGSKHNKCTVRAYTQPYGSIDRVKVNGTHSHLPRVV